MRGTRWRGFGLRLLSGLALGVALGLTCWAYLDPHVMVDVANQLWACF